MYTFSRFSAAMARLQQSTVRITTRSVALLRIFWTPFRHAFENHADARTRSLGDRTAPLPQGLLHRFQRDPGMALAHLNQVPRKPTQWDANSAFATLTAPASLSAARAKSASASLDRPMARWNT